MPIATRLLIAAIALLQLAPPLGAYARTPAPDTAQDFCSASHRPRSTGDQAPAGHSHVAHCLLCAHGAPPALPASMAWRAPLAQAFTTVPAMLASALPLLARHRANARAPPSPSLAVT